MKIVNNSNHDVTNQVNNVNCMYDNGDEGSQLSQFNVTIPANSSFPSDGQNIYIEAKASGTCAFETSTFTLTIGAAFNESDNTYSCVGNADNVNVTVDNSQAQARIVVTVLS